MGELHRINQREAEGRGGLTTALLVLCLLQRHAPRPLSTYEIGLWIRDNRDNPRPVSVIVKTLADDGYIIKQAESGKRAGLWAITDRGCASLVQRHALRVLGDEWLDQNPNLSIDEIAVLISLAAEPEQTPVRLCETVNKTISPVRTAIKRLLLRRLIARTENLFTGFALTSYGRNKVPQWTGIDATLAA